MLPCRKSIREEAFVGRRQWYERVRLGRVFDCGGVDWYDKVRCGGISVVFGFCEIGEERRKLRGGILAFIHSVRRLGL